MVYPAATDHLPQGFFFIKTFEPFDIRICNDRDGMIPDHTVVILSPGCPDGQEACGFSMFHQGVYKAIYPLGYNQCIKRVSRAVGIPERKGGIVFFVGCCMDPVIWSAVLPVHIADIGGLEKQPVETGIKNRFLF